MTEDVRPTALSVTLRLLGLRKQIGMFAKPCAQLRYGRRRGYRYCGAESVNVQGIHGGTLRRTVR